MAPFLASSLALNVISRATSQPSVTQNNGLRAENEWTSSLKTERQHCALLQALSVAIALAPQ